MGDYVKVYLNQIKDFVDRTPTLKKFATKIEETTKVKFPVLVAGLCVIILIMLFAGLFADLICHTIAIIYPMYMSILCLEKKTEVKFWITYWSK
jgi:hypothetical protein